MGTSRASATRSASAGVQVFLWPLQRWPTIDFEQPAYLASRAMLKFLRAIVARSISGEVNLIHAPFG